MIKSRELIAESEEPRFESREYRVKVALSSELYALSYQPLNMFKYEKLDIWQKAIEYADLIYKLTQSFPVEERFGLTSQLRRSAVSVSSNIAEGSSRSSDVDFARFIEIAYGSLLESVSELELAKRQQFLKEVDFKIAYSKSENLAKMLSGFRRTLKKPLSSQL